MCDFRSPPVQLKNNLTGEVYSVPYHGIVHGGNSHELKAAGFYYIACTGSHYIYWDGTSVHKNRDDWGPPSKEYWPETSGVHPSFFRYTFIYERSLEAYPACGYSRIGWFGNITTGHALTDFREIDLGDYLISKQKASGGLEALKRINDSR